MYFYRLKIVADATPNADGRWITVVVPRLAPSRYWQSVTTFFRSCTPRGEHLVQYERVDG